MAKKTALVLSGGGARGAFQCAAEKYAREVKGYHWDVIAGVSVGALNGAMLAMGKYQRLYEVWNTISSDRVYTGGFNLVSTLKLLLGAKSFYGNEPLQRMLAREFDAGALVADLRVGAVSLTSGEYVEFRGGDPHLQQAVLASTVMPIIWTPVNISPEYPAMVDGGVRNVSPVGDVLDANPDEVVIINCGPQAPEKLSSPPADIVRIGLRSLDLLLNELFQGDVREFLRINQLVKQAAARGVTLYHPGSGKPLKYYECKVIEPLAPLGDVLDFSQPAVQKCMRAGLERARAVLDGVRRNGH